VRLYRARITLNESSSFFKNFNRSDKYGVPSPYRRLQIITLSRMIVSMEEEENCAKNKFVASENNFAEKEHSGIRTRNW
jgi:hypothetical protein